MNYYFITPYVNGLISFTYLDWPLQKKQHKIIQFKHTFFKMHSANFKLKVFCSLNTVLHLSMCNKKCTAVKMFFVNGIFWGPTTQLMHQSAPFSCQQPPPTNQSDCKMLHWLMQMDLSFFLWVNSCHKNQGFFSPVSHHDCTELNHEKGPSSPTAFRIPHSGYSGVLMSDKTTSTGG